MPSAYDQYERRRRQSYTTSSTRGQTWGHWIPLAITVTVAAGGLAAWIWKERKDSEGDDYDPKPPSSGPGPSTHQSYGPPPTGPFQGGPGGNMAGPPPPPPAGQPPYGPAPETREAGGEESFVTRMSGALRRTPSPQQILDGASKKVAAGVAAAGAAVGGALSSITEERHDYEDHRSWSEEAESQSVATTSKSSRKGPELVDNEGSSVSQQTQVTVKESGKRKAVAVVVSAETDYDHDQETSYHQEHAVGSRVTRLEIAIRS